ncbi:hypothetical protein FHS84_002063 [Rhizomicrobium electricum]|nr:hypothetical protein [Rhizomicrobium electricum]
MLAGILAIIYVVTSDFHDQFAKWLARIFTALK